MQQGRRFRVEIRVGVPAEHGDLGPAGGGLQQAVVTDHDVTAQGTLGDVQ
jgi:hypothetical protein